MLISKNRSLFLVSVLFAFTTVWTNGATAWAEPLAAKKIPEFNPTVKGEIHDNWKGPLSEKRVQFSALMGLGDVNGLASFSVLGGAAMKVLHQGFAPDINNQVYAEVYLGPSFLRSESAFQ